jgi:uncharacterized membrane protein YhfC
VGVPVGLAIWGKVRYKKAFSFLPLLGGFLGFFISQIVFRINVLQYVLPQFVWYNLMAANPWLISIFLAVTAGLVEEFARFIVFVIMKKRRSFPDGFSYGIGHGGTEAILLVGLSLVNSLIYCLMINSGTWNTVVSALPQTQQAAMAQIGQQLVAAQPWTFLVGGFERICAILIQIALSLVVLKGFMSNKKWLYLLYAIGLHALVDFPAALYGYGVLKVGVLGIEGIVMVEAVIALLYIIKQARDYRKSLPEAAVVPGTETEPEKFPE